MTPDEVYETKMEWLWFTYNSINVQTLENVNKTERDLLLIPLTYTEFEVNWQGYTKF